MKNENHRWHPGWHDVFKFFHYYFIIFLLLGVVIVIICYFWIPLKPLFSFSLNENNFEIIILSSVVHTPFLR